MAKLLRLRRGTDTQHTTFTGAEGEVTVNTTNDSLHVHDGTTAGGRELARADLSNLPAGTIDNADINSSAAIANSKLATSGVTAGTYGSSSAIPAITVNDRGIVTSATTSAIDSTAITNGTSNVSVAASGNITATRSGTTRLTVDNGGVEVNGTFDVDGGNVAFTRTSGQLTAAFTATASNSVVEIGGSTGAYLDLKSPDSDDFDLRLGSTGTGGFLQAASGNITITGSVVPNADDTYDLGTSSAQWRNAYFDGTVNCDGFVCEGEATITAATGILNIQDSDSSGNATSNYIRGQNTNGAARWRVGQLSTGNEIFYVENNADQAIIFNTNGGNRVWIQNDGHLRPDANNTYDLGTSSQRWRNVYTNDLNLSNEGGANDVDGTWGSWTIQEGEDELFLLNRRNGKKYKFNLSEVN